MTQTIMILFKMIYLEFVIANETIVKCGNLNFEKQRLLRGTSQ